MQKLVPFARWCTSRNFFLYEPNLSIFWFLCYCDTHSHSAVSDKDRPILTYLIRAHFGRGGEIMSDILATKDIASQPTATNWNAKCSWKNLFQGNPLFLSKIFFSMAIFHPGCSPHFSIRFIFVRSILGWFFFHF